MRLPGHSMRARILWTTALGTALAMAIMIAGVTLALTLLSDHDIDTALDNQLDAVTATLQFGADGSVTELATPDDPIDDTTWVFDSTGTQVSGPDLPVHAQRTAESFAKARERLTIERRDRNYLAAPVTDKRTGKVGAVVVVSASRHPFESSRDQVLIALLLLGIVVTAGATAIASWTTRRALEPVESMAVLARDWSERDLDSRFEGAGRDEISRLGATLNVLLDRVAGAIRREQRLTSELAHELRTPLTAIRAEAELSLMSGADPRVSRVVDLADRMNGTINTLLAVARGSDQPDSRCEVEAVIRAAVADLPSTAIRLSVPESDLQVAAPLELAVRSLSPLVVNAAEHARAEVRITVRAAGRTVEIDVSDDGAGLAGVSSAELFTAGVRAPDSTGAGLGLALSRRVARTLGGDVRVTSAADPTTFVLTLPAF